MAARSPCTTASTASDAHRPSFLGVPRLVGHHARRDALGQGGRRADATRRGSRVRSSSAHCSSLRRAMARARLWTHVTHKCRRKGCAHREDAPDAAPRRCPKHGCLLWPIPRVRPIRFHDTRHSAASLLLMSGADAVAVQRLMRHADLRLTTETYGHLAPGYLQGELSKLRLLDEGKTAELVPLAASASATRTAHSRHGTPDDEPPAEAGEFPPGFPGVPKSGRRGSNPRPSAWEADALPLSYSRDATREGVLRAAPGGQSVSRRVLAERSQQIRSPQPRHPEEGRHLLAVAHGVVGPDRCPAAVDHRHPGPARARLEAHLDLGLLRGGEVRRPPLEDQPRRRLPGGHPASLDDPRPSSALHRLEEPPPHPGLETEQAGLPPAGPELQAGAPPGVDLLGEDLEGPRLRHLHQHRHRGLVSRNRRYPRHVRLRLPPRSAWALNACSCSPQKPSTSSSHPRNP